MTDVPANVSRGVGPGDAPSSGRAHRLRWAVLFFGSFAFYLLSATPNVQWQDAGDFVLRVIRGQVIDEQGLCRSHPLHFWLCTFAMKVLPFTIPFSCAAVSALGGAITVANVYGIVKCLTNVTSAAWLAATGLLLAHSFWRFSCFIEVYSVSAALLTAETWCLIRWDQTRKPAWLIAMFFFNGLGLANHDLALLSLPVIGIVFLIAWGRRQASFRTAVLGLLAWLAGSCIYLVMVFQDAHESGWRHAILSATVGVFADQVKGNSLVLFYTTMTIALTLLSFPNLMLPAAVLGVLRGRRMGIGSISFFAILGSLFMHTLFVLRYNVIDQYTFAIPAYGLLTVLSGLGFAVVQLRWPVAVRGKILGLAAGLLALAPVTYIVTATVARHFHVLLGPYARNKPYRDDYRYLLIPWARGEDSASHMSNRALDLAGKNGLIIEPIETKSFTIEYQLYVRKWDSVELIDKISPEKIAQHVAAHQPVVYVPYNVDQLPPAVAAGRWQRVEDLYVLQPAADSPATTQKAL